MDNAGNRFLRYALFGVFLLCLAISLSGPLWDTDLWWHLAAGKYFVENRSFLSGDPFSFTSGPELTLEAVLNGYWLGQVIFYLFYSALGVYGLIAVRVLVLMSMVCSVYLIARRYGASVYSTVALLVPAGILLANYTGERPQMFSFLLTPIVLYLLERLREGYRAGRVDKAAACLLPLVMLLWANLHRGFIMGSVLISLFAGAELARIILKRRHIERAFLAFCSVALVSVLATLLNPNFYLPYLEPLRLEGSTLQKSITEYISPVTLATRYGEYLPAYWLYLAACAGIFGLSARKLDRTHAVMFLFLAAMSLSAFRYIPFFVFASLPVAAFHLTNLVAGRNLAEKALFWISAALASVFLWITIAGFPNTLGMSVKHPIKPGAFPEGAVKFVAANSPSGNIFNHFNWGGYLIWTLYPRYKVFVDGRTLNLKAMSHYTYMLWDKETGPGLFDLYGINTIIIPPANPFSGEPYELVNTLRGDPQWSLVYRDGHSMVYVRGASNAVIAKKYSIPK